MKPPVPPEVPPPAALPEPPPELCVYRRQTCNLLRRYFRMSIELGRLPNILGREIFCQHSGASRPATFEDRVVFLHDIERCLQLLPPFDQQVIARCLFQDYSFEEAARPLQCNERTVRRRFPKAWTRLPLCCWSGICWCWETGGASEPSRRIPRPNPVTARPPWDRRKQPAASPRTAPDGDHQRGETEFVRPGIISSWHLRRSQRPSS